MKKVHFENHVIPDPLKTYVESIFYYKGFLPDHSIERVVPTGHFYIIFELDGFPRNTFDNQTLKPNNTFSKVWVSGMHKNYLSISAHQDSEMFVIQFKPYGSFPIFHKSISELNDAVVSAEEVFDQQILQIRENILKAPTTNEKFMIAENWLKSRFDQSKLPSIDLLDIINKLHQSPVSDHQEIIKSYPKTQKHLINQFKKYCGLTPKLLHRIFRFNDILQKINQKEEIEWSHIAYQCGFSDQSHFIKEFKEFSGFNPQEFIKMNMHLKEPNFFPLDEKG